MARERNFREKEEWVRFWVDPRLTRFERNPVRQKYFDSWLGRSRLVNGRNGGYNDKFNFNGRESKSFLFRNFLENCSLDLLRSTFSVVGEVIDLFCPKKRDKARKASGFVRFRSGQVKDINRTLEKLNSLWLGSFKIRAYWPKYDRNQTVYEPTPAKPFDAGMGLRSPDKSFKEVVARTDQLTKKDEQAIRRTLTKNTATPFEFSTLQSERDWLKSCWLGAIREKFSWEENGNEIRSECGTSIKIRYLGNEAALIQNMKEQPMKKVETDMEEWFSYWFEWFRLWREEDVCHRRKIWTRWTGIPAHTWSQRFFTIASGKIGVFLKLDQVTANIDSMEVARVLIAASFNQEINCSFPVKIDNRVYTIRIMEEVSGNPHEVQNQMNVDPRDASDWSSEDDEQLRVGPVGDYTEKYAFYFV